MAQESQYHTIPIENEPLLTDCGFTEFRLPLDDNATKMVLYNDKFKLMITYVDWDKHNDIDKAVKLVRDKLLAEQNVRESRVIESLCNYFRNACDSLAEDSSNDFFKNGNGKAKSNKSNKKQQRPQKGQREDKKRYIDTINDYNKIIEEFQKLYEQTPVTDRFLRARSLNGIKRAQEELARTQAEYEIFKKYKMRTALSK